MSDRLDKLQDLLRNHMDKAIEFANTNTKVNSNGEVFWDEEEDLSTFKKFIDEKKDLI